MAAARVKFSERTLASGVTSAFWLAVVLVLAPRSAALASEFTSTEAVNQLDVAGLTLDRDGMLWTAGSRGVCRFDGRAWSCPTTSPARAITAAPDGIIWAALVDGTVVKVRVGQPAMRVATIPGEVRRMSAKPGLLVIATAGGVYGISTDASPRLLTDAAAADAAFTRDGVLLVASGERLFEHRDGHPLRELARIDERISALAVDPRSADVWVGAESGRVYRVSAKGSSTLIVDRRVAVLSLAPRLDGGVWVGTTGGVLEVSRAGSFRLVNNTQGLPHNRITALAFDGARILWIGTAGGLALRRLDHPLRRFTRGDGLAGDTVFSVTSGGDGKVWVTTTYGAAALTDAGPLNLGPAEGLPGFDVRTIAFDRDGGLYVGAMNTGIYELRGARVTRVWPAAGLPGVGVRALRPRVGGGLWVGFERGGLAQMRHLRLETVIEPGPERRDRVYDVLELRDDGGLLLAFGSDGLAHWDGRRLRRFGNQDGLARNAEVVSLAASATADALVATNGAGLMRLRGGRLSSARQGLPDDRVFAAVEDGAGRTWISTESGIAAVASSQLDAAFDGSGAALSVRRFGPQEGVPGEPIRAFPPSAHRAADGTVLFPTLRGLVAFNPRALDVPSPHSRIVIDDVQVDGQSVSGATLQPSRRVALLIRFAAASYYPDASRSFRYRLEGLPAPEDAWQATQAATEVRYQRLPPGQYRFRVQRLSALPGQQSEEAAYDLYLSTPWYDRWVVRIPAGLGLAFALMALHRRRLRRLAQVHAAVLADRTRIARDIHDTLAQDLAGLRLQIEAAARFMDQDIGRAHEALGRASELISDGSIDLRNAIWGLRSSAVSSRELASALRTRIDRLTSGTRFGVTVEETGPAVFLSATQASHVVLAVRESVTNAIKHAAADRISVCADTTCDGVLEVRVSDDGKGLESARNGPPDERRGNGQGLQSLRDRMAAVGGSVTLDSSAEGTRVVLRVPGVEARGGEE